jgi:hypothetical protein
MPLTSTDERGYYEFRSDNVYFYMLDGTRRQRCVVTLEALERFDPQLNRGEAAQIACFDSNRARIERAASDKFDKRYLEKDGIVMVMANDV